jgi:hypothetical protein
MTSRHLAASICAIWLIGPISAGAQYTFDPAKVPDKSFSQYFDAWVGPRFMFNIYTNIGSPPDGVILTVAEFNSDWQPTTQNRLLIRDIDSTGITLELVRITFGPREVALYEHNAAMHLSAAAAFGGVAQIRQLAIMAALNRAAENIGTFSGDVRSERFRLPVPPVPWSFVGAEGRLRFDLDLANKTTVIAQLSLGQGTFTTPK